MFSQLNSKGSDVAIFSNPTRSRVLPGGKGNLTDWGQGVDIFAQLVKLFSWEEHVCEYFSEFENCFLTNGCQLLGVCRKVISVTSPRFPAANKFVSPSNIWISSNICTISTIVYQNTYCLLAHLYLAYILLQFLVVGVYFG